MASLVLTKELRGFLLPYNRAIRQVAARLRSIIFEEAPEATELVYDAYNAVAMSFSFTGRPGDSFCHIAVYANWVNLGFNKGSELPDPQRVLAGTGSHIRHIRMSCLADTERPFVRAYIRSAIQRAKRPEAAVSSTARPQSVVRAIYPKRRRPKR